MMRSGVIASDFDPPDKVSAPLKHNAQTVSSHIFPDGRRIDAIEIPEGFLRCFQRRRILREKPQHWNWSVSHMPPGMTLAATIGAG